MKNTPRILFHPLKHHLGHLADFARSLISEESFQSALLRIGTSPMDLYTGALTVAEIRLQIWNSLLERGLDEAEAYRAWLAQRNGHARYELSDGSRWILRWGNHPHSFVHIYPGRYSTHTVRVKAGTMKTALGLVRAGVEVPDTDTINAVRADAGLSPTKNRVENKGIKWAFSLLKNSMPKVSE
jgi:hypothetical protein